MNDRAFLELRNVTFSYDGKNVLYNVSLAVEKGGMLGLVGPNGAGKSTLLRLVAGTLHAGQGELLIDGSPVSALPSIHRARRIAVVPQNPTVPPGFTAMEVVLMARNPHLRFLQAEGPKDIEISRRAMELTGTWGFASRLLQHLSGGERQCVFIARALAQEPLLLLLDEPTAHLDIAHQKGVMDMLDEIRSLTGITVLVAIHDLTLAAQYCPRIAVLHQGQVVACGKPEDVLELETLERVYGTTLSLFKHPVNGAPIVLPFRKQTPK